MRKHHHLDCAVTQQPACFVKYQIYIFKKKIKIAVHELVPRLSTCSRLVTIANCPDGRPESAESTVFVLEPITDNNLFFVRADGGLFAC
jgi:hypothetical protein